MRIPKVGDVVRCPLGHDNDYFRIVLVTETNENGWFSGPAITYNVDTKTGAISPESFEINELTTMLISGKVILRPMVTECLFDTHAKPADVHDGSTIIELQRTVLELEQREIAEEKL